MNRARPVEPSAGAFCGSRVAPASAGTDLPPSGVVPGLPGCSGMEDVPPDRSHVGEDPNAEDDDDAGRQLAADAQLVAEEHDAGRDHDRSEEHTSELQSLMRISYAVF